MDVYMIYVKLSIALVVVGHIMTIKQEKVYYKVDEHFNIYILWS